MPDAPRQPDHDGDGDGLEYERESTGLPRWVKVAGIVAAVLVLLVIVVMLVSGGHTPRRHGLADNYAPVWTVHNGGFTSWSR